MQKGQILGLVLGITFVSAGAVQAKETWMCNIFTGPKHFINKPSKQWGKDVKKVTNGDVVVRYLPASAAPPPKQIDGLAAGTFDCAFIFHGFTKKRAIGPQFGILPMINPGNAEQGSVAFWKTWNKHFAKKKEFAKHGVKVLSQYQFPGVQFMTAKDKPINSMSDMKSQKMWALAGTSSRILKVAGVSHISGPAVRLGEFTQTKVIQGIAGTTLSGGVYFAGVNFVKWGTFTRRSIMMPSFQWMVSLKKWNALSSDNKRKIMSVSGEKLSRAVGVIADKMEIINGKKLAKAGFKIVKASKQFENELKKAGQPQIDAWIARAKKLGVDGNKVINDFAKYAAE
jgi:TRAP-type C4-dicarboxylate transport system substrate-binding protein